MWLCEEMGLPYRVAKVTFPPSKDYLALHPLGSVPFLEDGEVKISESIAMMIYIAERYGPTPFLPAKTDPALARVLQMAVFAEASIGGALNTLMAAHFGAPDADKRNWSIRGVEATVERAFNYVQAILGDNPYLVGKEPTIADMAITTTLGIWQGALGKPVPEKLVPYRERLAARPAYQRAREKSL
jgi:glutathione S-transferase